MAGGLIDHQHDVVHLWTIQRVEAWRLAQEKGVLQADGRRVFHDYRYAYMFGPIQLVQVVIEESLSERSLQSG